MARVVFWRCGLWPRHREGRAPSRPRCFFGGAASGRATGRAGRRRGRVVFLEVRPLAAPHGGPGAVAAALFFWRCGGLWPRHREGRAPSRPRCFFGGCGLWPRRATWRAGRRPGRVVFWRCGLWPRHREVTRHPSLVTRHSSLKKLPPPSKNMLHYIRCNRTRFRVGTCFVLRRQ